ncbi:GDSL-type esterase/lipase family protein [Salinithrix halophila]|uniref:GDSL-type esterase/lipase family protein n=1 Tax=Salinithrix halophila TaxID=1485204 RepID=A0ABV8JAM1_9BACL
MGFQTATYCKGTKKGRVDLKRNLDRILSALREENPDVPVLLLGLYDPYPGPAGLDEYVKEWNKTSREVIRRHPGVTFIPTNELFRDKQKEVYFSDSLHPNHRGYALIVQQILKEYDFGEDE